jgi:acyl-CoA thioester hydrolase
MNVMWYVGKFDEATWQFFSSIGLSRSRLSKEGTGMAAVEQRIEYKRELHAGDLFTIRSAGSRSRKNPSASATKCPTMRQEIAARTTLVAVYFDTSPRKSRPIPADIRERVGLVLTPTYAAF